MLLAREQVACVPAVARLGALQAQLPRPAYVALWSRIEGFRREELTEAVTRRALVRGTLFRGTLHLVAAEAFATFRPLLQPALTKGLRSTLRERADALDVDGLIAATKAYLRDGPRTFEQIRDHLESLKLPGDERARGFAVRMTLPLVQVPDGSAWGYPANCPFALAEDWLAGSGASDTGAGSNKGAPGGKRARSDKRAGSDAPGREGGADARVASELSPEEREDRLVMAYLRAFGPATAADAQSFTGLSTLKAAFERLRPSLMVFRDERGKDLFDLPDSPRPDPDTPAPVRFLPEFDSLGLAHDNRARLVDDEHRKLLFRPNLLNPPMFLVDGRVAGTWSVDTKKKVTALELTPYIKLSKSLLADLTKEGESLLRFLEPAAKSHEVRAAKEG